VFLGFSDACASTGSCRLLKLLHNGATGEEVKRLIEDAHDVSSHPYFFFSCPFSETNIQLALKVFLTKPTEDIVYPGLIRCKLTFTASPNHIRVFTNWVYSPDTCQLVRARDLEPRR